jgi:hypothetical protein
VSLDALAVLFAALGFMIPVSAGVQDGGLVLLSVGFNLGATAGAAFSLARRVREAFWLSLGLLVTARENALPAFRASEYRISNKEPQNVEGE